LVRLNVDHRFGLARLVRHVEFVRLWSVCHAIGVRSAWRAGDDFHLADIDRDDLVGAGGGRVDDAQLGDSQHAVDVAYTGDPRHDASPLGVECEYLAGSQVRDEHQVALRVVALVVKARCVAGKVDVSYDLQRKTGSLIGPAARTKKEQ